MHRDFINALRTGLYADDLFEAEFNSYHKLQAYLRGKTTSNIFSEIGVGPITNDQAKAAFQKLAILVWIARPVYSGAYILKFSEDARAQVDRVYAALTNRRFSSHMHSVRTGRFDRHGRSAVGLLDRHRMGFIKGINEILLHRVGEYLYLKLEGEQAVSFGHAMSYIRSRISPPPTAKNAAIQSIRETNPTWIEFGRKEAVGPNFKSLCKHLRIPKNQMTVSYVIQRVLWLRANLSIAGQPESVRLFVPRPLGVVEVRDLFERFNTRIDIVGLARAGIRDRLTSGHIFSRNLTQGKIDLENLCETLARTNRFTGEIEQPHGMLVALRNWVSKAWAEVENMLNCAEGDSRMLMEFEGGAGHALPLHMPILVDADRWGLEVRMTGALVDSLVQDFINHDIVMTDNPMHRRLPPASVVAPAA